MMIAGRTIQDISGGGIKVMIDMIVSNMDPSRERGKFIGMFSTMLSIGTPLSPFISGALVQHSSWRWAVDRTQPMHRQFYLNPPVGGAALVFLVLFLHINYQQERWKEKVKKVDYIGNAILMTSIVSILLVLARGSTAYI
ncbi:Major Facilitator Superfamily protein [Penicillium hordei]|uniref:Major Facilitator Superfamily protein n=1 Tax=Penicillium hordei TaxID=40994 RepID=A0AAD6DMX2_9EURO|nr:Major Facilitator Superfamily protein [Penicillium hordei]KAJ5589358.1 Major Facilitator Superfamily protein [Penicillium hordei]